VPSRSRPSLQALLLFHAFFSKCRVAIHSSACHPMSSPRKFARIHRMLHRTYAAGRDSFAPTLTLAFAAAIISARCTPEHYTHDTHAVFHHTAIQRNVDPAPTKLPAKAKPAISSQLHTGQTLRPTDNNKGTSAVSPGKSNASNDWQFCLAPFQAQHLVYISLPFPKDSHTKNAFAQMLHQVPHDDIQCPIANDKASISDIRQHALSFNRKAGNTIVTWQRPKSSQPKSKNIHTGQIDPRSDNLVWQYCLASSYEEKKVYISPPFAKGTDVDIAFAQMLHQVQHEAIQCPIADNEASISTMRQHAISFNRSAGNLIVKWEPSNFSHPASENIRTGTISVRSNVFFWQYCLAPSDAEKKVYISSPFPRGPSLNTENAFAAMLSQSNKQHDDVQCPIGKDKPSILSMRKHAISFNHDRGYAIITRNWEPSN
jgi:hypothetical protein